MSVKCTNQIEAFDYIIIDAKRKARGGQTKKTPTKAKMKQEEIIGRLNQQAIKKTTYTRAI